jgi:hypothetical protein
MVDSAPASIPSGVYTMGDSAIGEGIVTMVDPMPASADEATVEARLFAVLDDGVSVEIRPAFNDEMVVMARCFVIFGGCLVVICGTTGLSGGISTENKESLKLNNWAFWKRAAKVHSPPS